MRITKVALAAAGVLLSANASAVSMSGGEYYGVASLEGARAALTNPALLSIHDGNLVDILVPRITVNYSDQDDIVNQVEELTDFVDAGPQDFEYLTEIESRLVKLSESNRIEAAGGFDAAVSTTLPFGVGGAVFFDSHVMGTAVTNLAEGSDSLTIFNDSSMDLIGLAVLNIGLSAAYTFELPVGEFAIGVSPKGQSLKVYGESVDMRTFDFDLSEDGEVSSTQANVDVGLAYSWGPITAGLAGKNLISHELDLDVGSSNYRVSVPAQYTLGAGFDGGFFKAAIDVELSEYEIVDGLGGSQKTALSGEVDVLPMLTLRGAYIFDMSTDEHVGSLGAGIALFPLTQFDVDAGISNEGDFSVGASFSVYL
ncbi:conjugal transfer protein TraF [Vibrio owensii]|uniref:conjugal transfer protein TraF n=1 Tax=Vibrio owensii TaxID=696485 RepID=UPI0018F18F5B|nr:conjugal transfer protein TraF [Vibrio owensii]